ncbi:MAG: ABC transporter substrate-binding protein, partial [Candidatus Eremiobacteraeota bacterium]|nr:ABC transporter substrate-binding protein [Candidatus Eremiobacteraeota bacterium]
PSIKPVPFDIAKANALLDAAGWKRGADGIRAKNGAKLALDVAVVTGDPQADGMFELIRGWWKQIGVSLSIQHYLSSLMFAPYADGGILYKGKFDVVYFQWGSDAIGDYSFIYGCDQIPPNGQNVLHWCNQPATAATHALFGHFDQTQRNGDVKIVEEQLDKEVPTIVVMGTQQVWVWNKDFKNFQPNAVSPFDNFMNADI